MTIIVEYRVPMPFSAAEYRIGQLYTIAKKSRLESSAATEAPKVDGKTAASLSGVQINANEPYAEGPGGSGQYTNKTYHLAQRIPDCLKRLLPEAAGQLVEEAWNAYPYSRNRFTSPICEKLRLEIESHYLDGPPVEANVFGLEGEEAKRRSIVVIDVAKDKYKTTRKWSSSSAQPYGEREMLAFRPLRRPPLTDNWLQEYEMANEGGPIVAADDDNGGNTANNNNNSHKTLMTCYKLCRISFPVWALESKVEQFMLNSCRDTIIEAHRQAWLWQDEWAGMSLEEIRMMEKATQAHLNGLANGGGGQSSVGAN